MKVGTPKLVHASDWGSDTTLCGKQYKDFTERECTTSDDKFAVTCEDCRKKLK